VPEVGDTAIEVTGLTVRYGGLTAVDGIDFEARAGQVTAVLGRNGAGKTSTVETLEGYRPGAIGRVSVLGLDPRRPADHRKLVARIGVMLQQGGVYPGVAPLEAVELFAAFYDDPEDPAALVDRLGLTDVARTPWRRLSGGEQQRLSLCLALVGRPEVVFMDEPTAGVDPAGRLVIRQEIHNLRGNGTCVVLTTHELQEAERVADQVVIIDRGRVVAAGTPEELMSLAPREANARIRFRAPAGIDAASLGARLGAPVTEVSPGEYEIGSPGDPAVVAALAAWLAERDLPMSDLSTGARRLEDVFLDLIDETSDGPDERKRPGRRPG
jgi:ABC-2 type transport system ATP-binding protein